MVIRHHTWISAGRDLVETTCVDLDWETRGWSCDDLVGWETDEERGANRRGRILPWIIYCSTDAIQDDDDLERYKKASLHVVENHQTKQIDHLIHKLLYKSPP